MVRGILGGNVTINYKLLYLPETNDLSFLIGLDGLAAKWETIGIHLGVPVSQLAVIQRDNHDCVTRLSGMFVWWLRNGKEVTAEKLAETVHKVNQHKAEVEIKRKYGKWRFLLPAGDQWEGVVMTLITT